MYRCLAFILVLPWPEVSDAHQEWDRRSKEVESLVGGASEVFLIIQRNPVLLQNENFIERGIYIA